MSLLSIAASFIAGAFVGHKVVKKMSSRFLWSHYHEQGKHYPGRGTLSSSPAGSVTRPSFAYWGVLDELGAQGVIEGFDNESHEILFDGVLVPLEEIEGMSVEDARHALMRWVRERHEEERRKGKQ